MIKKFLTVLVLGLAVFAVSCSSADLTDFALEGKDVSGSYTVSVAGEADAEVVITVKGEGGVGAVGTFGVTAKAITTTLNSTLKTGDSITAKTTEDLLKKLVSGTDNLSDYTVATEMTVDTTDDETNDYSTKFEATYTDADEKTKTVKFTVNVETGDEVIALTSGSLNAYADAIAAIAVKIGADKVSASDATGTGIATFVATPTSGTDSAHGDVSIPVANKATSYETVDSVKTAMVEAIKDKLAGLTADQKAEFVDVTEDDIAAALTSGTIGASLEHPAAAAAATADNVYTFTVSITPADGYGFATDTDTNKTVVLTLTLAYS